MNSEAMKLKVLVSLWYIDLESRYIPDTVVQLGHMELYVQFSEEPFILTSIVEVQIYILTIVTSSSSSPPSL